MRRRFRLSYRISMTGAQKAKLFCFLVSSLTMVLIIICTIHLKALLGNLAVTRVTGTVNRLVASAVNNAIESGEIQYTDLITFEKDNEGNIAALQSNMAEFNRLQSKITQDVLQRLNETSNTELSIPIGTLLGSAVLAGRGPGFKVKMQTVGSCAAHFENQFSDAGINQTTHRILLYVDVSVSIMLPGFKTYTQVNNAFSVAETVIVGSVPESYTYFNSGNAVEEDAYEYSMNNA